VARANADALGLAGRVGVEHADVTGVPLAGWSAAWIDPSRRAGGRRTFDPGAYAPPLSFVTQLAAAVSATGAKVGPGIAHALIPPGAEAEWVSVGGEVKEAALWFGPLATAARRATLLPAAAVRAPDRGDSGGWRGRTGRPGRGTAGRWRGGPGSQPAATLVGAGLGPPPVGAPGPWLYEPDGAVIRAGLVAEVAAALPGGRLLDPTIAYIAADAAAPTPFARAYPVTDVLPFSVKRLRALLRGRGVGRVTVKTRGSAVDPEHLRRELRLSGDGSAVVVLTRVAGRPTALVCSSETDQSFSTQSFSTGA
jgi:THUMP domain-like